MLLDLDFVPQMALSANVNQSDDITLNARGGKEGGSMRSSDLSGRECTMQRLQHGTSEGGQVYKSSLSTSCFICAVVLALVVLSARCVREIQAAMDCPLNSIFFLLCNRCVCIG